MAVILSVPSNPDTFTSGNWPASHLNDGIWHLQVTPTNASTNAEYTGGATHVIALAGSTGGLIFFNNQLEFFDTSNNQAFSVALTWSAGQTIDIWIDTRSATRRRIVSGATTGNGSATFTEGGPYFDSTQTLGVGTFVSIPGTYDFNGTISDIDDAVTTLDAESGSYTMTGTAASVEHHRRLAAESGSYSITGTAARLIYTWPALEAESGSYAITGTDAALEHNREIAAESGSYTLTGTSAGLELARRLVAEAGSYAITGTDARLIYTWPALDAESGSYTLTGTAAGLELARRLVAESGAYTLTGTDADLTVSSGLTLEAEPGSYTLTGTAANLEHHRRLVAESGSYSLTGTDAGLELARRLVAEAGGYTLTGTAAALEHARVITAEGGAYTLTGTAAALLYARILEAESGTYTITGFDATLTAGAVAADFRPPYQVETVPTRSISTLTITWCRSSAVGSSAVATTASRSQAATAVSYSRVDDMSYEIKTGDLTPTIRATLKDQDGTAVAFVGTETVTFKWRIKGTSSWTSGTGAFTAAASGTVYYQWTSGQTDTAGTYESQWVITNVSSQPRTFPSEGYELFYINS